MQLTDPQVAKVREKFDEFDVDGSGTIEKAEFLSVSQWLCCGCAVAVLWLCCGCAVSMMWLCSGTIENAEFMYVL